MRKYGLIVWAFLAIGCAGPGFSGVPWVGQRPQQSQLAGVPPAPPAPQQTPGFTRRMANAVIPGFSKETPSAYPNKVSSAQQKADPISLGFESGPPSAALYLSMAQLSDRGGNVEHARSMYQRALSIEPNHLESLLGLARLEDREGRLNEALRIYQQAAAAYPQNAQVLNDLGLCHARMGQLPVSLQLLGQATQLQPQKQLYRNNIAKVLIELNRIDEAASHQAAVHPPAVAQYNMGVLLHQRGRTEEAVRFLTAATHIDPQLQAAGALLSQITSRSTRIVGTGQSVPNDGVLPTPLTSPASGQPYPTTGALSAAPSMQTLPAETAQVPVGHSPVLLPPVR